jgi:hypothetical protein
MKDEGGRMKVTFGTAFILAILLSGLPAFGQEPAPEAAAADTALMTQPEGRAPKSAWKAAGLSLAVPGLGEAYAGAWGRAKTFFIAEGATWAGFAAFRVYGRWRADDYRVFAADHAGVTLSGQGDAFFRDIGAFSSSDAYNFEQLLTQRERARLYTGVNTWAWDSDAARKAYLDIRRSSRRARLRSVYLVGFALAARLVSAVDARKAVGGAGLSAGPSPDVQVSLPPDGILRLTAGVRF